MCSLCRPPSNPSPSVDHAHLHKHKPAQTGTCMIVDSRLLRCRVASLRVCSSGLLCHFNVCVHVCVSMCLCACWGKTFLVIIITPDLRDVCYLIKIPSIVAETISLLVVFHQPVCKLCADVVLLFSHKKKREKKRDKTGGEEKDR